MFNIYLEKRFIYCEDLYSEMTGKLQKLNWRSKLNVSMTSPDTEELTKSSISRGNIFCLIYFHTLTVCTR